MADKSWVTDQYDRYVQGNTVLAQPEDAGVVRIDAETHLGVAVSTDCNGRFAKLDPYAGAQLALAESYRNVAVTGALPLAVTDCLNFGSPENPDVMWQFEQATHGLKDACAVLGIPVTGGNVSFYNQTGETPILPTPVVGVLGVIDDVRQRITQGFTGEGSHVLVLGETREELSRLDLGRCRARSPRRAAARRRPVGRVRAGRPHGRGGQGRSRRVGPRPLGRRACDGPGRGVVRHGIGVTVDLEDPFLEVFSESSARAMVVVAEDRHDEFVELAEQHGSTSRLWGVRAATRSRSRAS